MKLRRLLALSFLTLFSCLPVGSYLITELYYFPKIEKRNQRLATLFPKIIQDLNKIEDKPVFKKVSYNKDARDFLDFYISWQGGKIPAINSRNHQIKAYLMQRYPHWREIKLQLQALMADPALQIMDLSWFEELEYFDHWNLLHKPEIIAELKQIPYMNSMEKVKSSSSLPIPDYIEFRDFANLYYLKNYKKPKAINHYLQAAYLAHSAGSLISNSIATHMIREIHFIHKQLDTSNLPELEKVDALYRLSWAWTDIIRYSWKKEIPHELKAYMKPEFGVCSGLFENTLGLNAFSDYFKPSLPLEVDFKKEIYKNRKLMVSLLKKCNVYELSVYLEDTPEGNNPWFYDDNKMFHVGGSKGYYLNLSKIPYLRRAAGLELMSIALPSYTRKYEEIH